MKNSSGAFGFTRAAAAAKYIFTRAGASDLEFFLSIYTCSGGGGGRRANTRIVTDCKSDSVHIEKPAAMSDESRPPATHTRSFLYLYATLLSISPTVIRKILLPIIDKIFQSVEASSCSSSSVHGCQMPSYSGLKPAVSSERGTILEEYGSSKVVQQEHGLEPRQKSYEDKSKPSTRSSATATYTHTQRARCAAQLAAAAALHCGEEKFICHRSILIVVSKALKIFTGVLFQNCRKNGARGKVQLHYFKLSMKFLSVQRIESMDGVLRAACPLIRKFVKTTLWQGTHTYTRTWLADADGQAAIWVHGGIPVQERPARVHPYFAWARIGGIFFFSVYAPPRLSEREFSALLANITEEARGRRPLVIAGDFNAWSTEWGCRETRPRASILLDSLALLDAVLLNTGDVPTFNGRQGSSIVDLTFVCETLAPRVKSWTVSEWYTHSDHQAVLFEIEDTGTTTRPSTRQSCRWNARTLDADCFSATVSSASVAPGTAEDMASSLMSVITGACDASMSKANPRRRREPVYWWTAEIADLRRSCLRARRLLQRSRGRHDEETHSANYASARRLLRVAIKTSKRRCWRQLCDEVDNDVWGKPYKVAMSRLGCPQAKQPSSPLLVRGAVAALFPRVPSGPALRLPRRAEEPIRPLPWRNSKELSRGSRSAPRPARMAYPTRRSRSLLLHDPTSSCGCTRRVWRPAYSHLSGSARGLS
ncbi:unnamed protein product [Trichogramma brassicae]|uniref:Endonuclease/exonuclease/phosphatase domain-containing protein n=1 Tax=Trichogramma brassicae TaxID=86971 RepID=A0A6H5IY73_9HYME|nr:unnamed protein product [Trichogramma brassicae]